MRRVYGAAGRHDDARRLLGVAEKLKAAGHTSPTTFAMGYIGLQDWNTAFDWMDRAIEARDLLLPANELQLDDGIFAVLHPVPFLREAVSVKHVSVAGLSVSDLTLSALVRASRRTSAVHSHSVLRWYQPTGSLGATIRPSQLCADNAPGDL